VLNGLAVFVIPDVAPGLAVLGDGDASGGCRVRDLLVGMSCDIAVSILSFRCNEKAHRRLRWDRLYPPQYLSYRGGNLSDNVTTIVGNAAKGTGLSTPMAIGREWRQSLG
jgi:hypothetical protein